MENSENIKVKNENENHVICHYLVTTIIDTWYISFILFLFEYFYLGKSQHFNCLTT